MKYTLPKSYSRAGLQVTIPDSTLQELREECGGTKAAISAWLFRNGYIQETEYAALSTVSPSTNKTAPRPREFKVDPVKSSIIDFIEQSMRESSLEVTNVTVTNRNRQISFSLGEDKYELTLVKKKK